MVRGGVKGEKREKNKWGELQFITCLRTSFHLEYIYIHRTSKLPKQSLAYNIHQAGRTSTALASGGLVGAANTPRQCPLPLSVWGRLGVEESDTATSGCERGGSRCERDRVATSPTPRSRPVHKGHPSPCPTCFLLVGYLYYRQGYWNDAILCPQCFPLCCFSLYLRVTLLLMRQNLCSDIVNLCKK